MLSDTRGSGGRATTDDAFPLQATLPRSEREAFTVRVAGSAAARAIDWARPHLVIGSSDSVGLRVAHDRTVSRQHCRLTLEPGGALRIEDLTSRNGTYVNGVRVVEARLWGGEVVRVGETIVLISRVLKLEGSASPPSWCPARLVGESIAMRELLRAAERVIHSGRPLLIVGESGTGRRALAEAIHDAWRARGGQLQVVDALASMKDLDDAFAQAEGGTLVLSNLERAPSTTQAWLHSAIPRHPETRLVATMRPDGRDRSDGDGDLVPRLGGAQLVVPPLRERHGDVGLIASKAWAERGYEGPLPRSALLLAQRHSWPGNVSELLRWIDHVATTGDSTLPKIPRRPSTTTDFDDLLSRGLAFSEARDAALRSFEMTFLEHALEEHHGNITRAAAAAGVTRRYFNMLMARSKSSR